MKKIQHRKDPLTGELFIPKKVTQKFKTRENQIKYNNELQSLRRQFLGPLLSPLLKTHRILSNAIGTKNTITLHKEWLKGAGADMTLFTHVETIDAKRFHAIFNFTIAFDKENYRITKIKDYENSNL
jgi:hypothetical protein